jgi:2-polyprenyl-3-methyl-5-hydroxy-6-metoxy-1,4-benzoquinol methylase
MVPKLRFFHFLRRSTGREIMDDPASSEARLRATLRQFSLINRCFSRTHAHFRRFILSNILKNNLRQVTILDVGAGGGDFARWCVSFLKRRGVVPRVICLDNDERVINYLRGSCAAFPEIEIVHASLFQLEKVRGPIDYVVSTHVLHHLEDAQIPGVLAHGYAVASRGMLIVDLERSTLAYFMFSVFSAVFFHGGFTRLDGLISIKKGFTSEDVRGYIDTAELSGLLDVRASAVWHIVIFGTKRHS